MSKSHILYKDIAPMAKNDAAVTATGATGFSDLNQVPHGSNPGKIATLELNQWVLDGEHELLDNQVIALWSEELSGENRMFQNTPIIDIRFSLQHSSLGLTLVFDEADGGYCDMVNIKWYQGDTLLSDVDFQPDSTRYFAQQKVTSYDRIAITMMRTSLPYHRAKLNHIIFGIYRYFDMRSLRKVKIINQTNLLSVEIPVSTMDINMDSRDDLGFMFQLKQPVESWNDSNLIGVYYIDEHTRAAENLYSIGCYDAWGVLDETPFQGGYYAGVSAKTLLTQIIGADFVLDMSEISDIALTGIITPTTRRGAAQQVLFAAGWSTATDGGEEIRVFSTDKTLSVIGKNRTYFGAKSTISSVVTEVRVTAHTYTQDNNGSVEVNGLKYSDTETIYSVVNSDVTASDKQNIIEISNATLISTANGQATAQRVYDYYQLRQRDESKIVWKGERLGDYVQLPTAWGTEHPGHIEKMTINLSNTVAADLETIGSYSV